MKPDTWGSVEDPFDAETDDEEGEEFNHMCAPRYVHALCVMCRVCVVGCVLRVVFREMCTFVCVFWGVCVAGCVS